MSAGRRTLVLIALALLGGACDGRPAVTVEVPELDAQSDASAGNVAILRKAARLLEADASREAEPLLRQLVNADSNNEEARALLIDLLVDAQRYEEALPLLRTSIEAEPKDVRSRELLARTTHAMGDVAAAEKAYRGWLRADRTNDDALFGLGQLLYQEGRLEEALVAFERAEKRRAGRADIRSELGLTLQALGRLEEAEAKQRDALERDPRSAEPWFRLGDVISKRDDGRLVEAIEAIREAVRRDRSHLHAQLYLYRLLRLGEAAGMDGLAAEAEKRWKSVLSLHGRRQVRSRAAAPRRRPSGARDERELLEVLAATPDDVGARRELAEWLHVEGHLDEAVEAYEIVLAAGSAAGSAGANSRDTELLVQAGTANLVEGRATRAVELLSAAVGAPDCPPEVQRHLAWALLLDDRAVEAVAAAGAAMESAPDDRLARLCQGLARMRTGNLDGGLQEIAAAGWLR
jgi:tetratricopeptide (TPR) repeat protein